MKMNKYKSYLTHPRYGNSPMKNGYKYTLEEINKSFWRYSYVKVFPASAISADISKQNHSGFPREIYVDMEAICKRCHSKFLFFALEQKYWYEVLRFYVDADCTKCIECRKLERKIKEKALRYEELIKKKEKTKREIKDLKYVAYDLYELGYLKNKSKLEQILKMKEE